MKPEPVPFDLVRACFLARASAHAYEVASPDGGALAGYVLLPWTNGALAGYVARKDDQVVLAFRGTAAENVDRNHALRQWLANLDYRQVAQGSGLVHRGFSDALDLIWNRVTDGLNATLEPGCSLWVTGHSLGGALATLAAARLVNEAVPVVGVYTFGSPRVGDAACVAAVHRLVHSVENGNDLICHLPPPPGLMKIMRPLVESGLGRQIAWSIPTNASYADAGQLTYIDRQGHIWPAVPSSKRQELVSRRLSSFLRASYDGNERESLFDDHRIENYVAKLASALHSV